MITRLRRSFANLASEQRRVGLAALLVLASMLLPWYSKTTNAITKNGLANVHESKLAILVPSFVEASIFLVAVAVLVLMFFRGEGRAFHLPFGDGIVCTAAGAWVAFLVFYRFIDQPSGGTSKNLAYSYDLSWGIFFGLLAAAFLIYSGTRLRLANVAEPPLPGEGPTAVAPRPAPAPTVVAPTAPDSAADRERRRREREARRRGEDETVTAPAAPPTTRQPARPDIDGGTQLSFDEQE
ncbi:hypothetical protein DSM104299_04648 [Baekduia alba]|uniref:hypothetical protein n=1 Tax=Baekduia alba TaxID=2997333 RepID=UPI002341DB2F|nr:hypothetical protein [Baekduia alba]WCB95897.1 hypothetical protein DSM104299_04648 [Baekduia alba]